MIVEVLDVLSQKGVDEDALIERGARQGEDADCRGFRFIQG